MKQLYLLLLLTVSANSFSQTANGRRCGAYEAVLHRDEVSPGYLQRVNETFNFLNTLSKETNTQRESPDTIFRIQTVFHVVYTSPQENIPDSLILSQIEVLNEDYRRKNADTTLTRSVFLPVAADCGIEFVLAHTDPEGNPTNGITRTAGNGGIIGFNPFQDNVKSNSSGGKSPWPTDRYLNIWVCNILNGLGVLGYAFPPSGLPHWPNGSTTDSSKQGVVLHYRVVGRNNSNPMDPTVDKGRSATHEIGHYLGLRHIWADDQGACMGSAQGDSDGMDDTPDQGDAHQQTCSYADNSCPDSPTDFPDMLENYMDYSDDNCLNMFTREQANMMRTVLRTSRAGIAEVITGVPEAQDDFSLVEIFPNPAGDLLAVHLRLNGNFACTLDVIDLMGQPVLPSEVLPSGTSFTTLRLNTLAQGLYLIKLSSPRQSVVKHFVKK